MFGWTRWLLGAWTAVVLATGAAAAVDETRTARYDVVGRDGLVGAADAGARTGLSSTTARSATPAADAVSAPVSVEAPAVALAAPLVPVGKAADGALAVPDFGNAGWYRHSVRPGAPGAAVLAGHVDSTTGPDVFFALGDLQPGDHVVIRHHDATTSTFVVDHREMTDKDELPVDRIFDHPDRPELRLITCGGGFDRSAGSYESNVIVYAHLIDSDG